MRQITARAWHPFDVVAGVLAERLRGREPSAELSTTLSHRQINWQGVIARASHQYVLAGFAAALQDLNLAGSLDLELRQFLAAIHAANVERNLRLRSQLAEAVAALNRIDIEPVLLKGAIRLVDGLYPDVGWRMMRDLDMLVPNTRLDAAGQALRRAGYIADRRTTKSREMAASRVHLPGLRHPGHPALVEVHRSLFLPSRGVLEAAEVFDGSRLAPFEGVVARVPSSEHQAMHLIGHCQITDHGYVLASVQLRDLLEAAALARWSAGGVAWQIVFERFAAAGHRRAFLSFLLALAELEFCARPPWIGIDLLTTLQTGRAVRRARAATTRGAPFVNWIMLSLTNFVLARDMRRYILALPAQEIWWRLCHRGPRLR